MLLHWFECIINEAYASLYEPNPAMPEMGRKHIQRNNILSAEIKIGVVKKNEGFNRILCCSGILVELLDSDEKRKAYRSECRRTKGSSNIVHANVFDHEYRRG